ncbi:hypothetical protein J2Y45_003830 [Dyadobacter sp. BE34]|uniref:Uncharacterized protein n=1 Tax=Dyadobacter fermentans TaxID=94254 RepID=A0ABU1QZQ4_9BACT|nr:MULTISPECIES: hypothetical protein [Dyadobacter]MDR6806638.1 hypothetical protein [Dyadobacter fermentans]MDR7044380.1 hypothetical protein [Dyadobacter sp. BE242]MDR7198690.1 hypothetical protein [Dyadobacter sp. BE34]MDR7216652.1 hypothetical protein [Dyadobacter sp. BE31]MDR7263822.1 hypothetical protein [Dyadobacter sp. BE32]
MKTFVTTAFAILLFLCVWTERRSTDGTINPIIGDVSFEKKYGTIPNADTDDQVRIAAHLEYTEKELRKRDVSQLSAQMRSKRMHLLDLLRDYRSAGLFPKNYERNERKPCFIDQNGTICAVGYLIEQTAGRAAAEDINSRHKYDTILEMNDRKVDEWIAGSGLSKEECAMIQPQYAPGATQNVNNVKPSYAISSTLLMGVNVASTVVNGIQVATGSMRGGAPALGIIGGTGQITMGIIGYKKKADGSGMIRTTNYGNNSQRSVSMLNMAVGSLTIGMSIWNIAAHKKQVERRSVWDIRSFPDAYGKSGVALAFTHKF